MPWGLCNVTTFVSHPQKIWSRHGVLYRPLRIVCSSDHNSDAAKQRVDVIDAPLSMTRLKPEFLACFFGSERSWFRNCRLSLRLQRYSPNSRNVFNTSETCTSRVPKSDSPCPKKRSIVLTIILSGAWKCYSVPCRKWLIEINYHRAHQLIRGHTNTKLNSNMFLTSIET